MKKFYISALFSLFMGLTASAEDAQWCLVVNGSDANKLAIAVADKPVVSTSDEGYVVKYGEESLAFSWTDIKTITMEETAPTTAIEQTTNETPAVKLKAGDICVSGAKAGSKVTIYAANGQVIRTAEATNDGSLIISTSNLPKGGVYIVKTPSQTFKIKK